MCGRMTYIRDYLFSRILDLVSRPREDMAGLILNGNSSLHFGLIPTVYLFSDLNNQEKLQKVNVKISPY